MQNNHDVFCADQCDKKYVLNCCKNSYQFNVCKFFNDTMHFLPSNICISFCAGRGKQMLLLKTFEVLLLPSFFM